MEFNLWDNPMEKAYKDVKFNRYTDGPGSELPPELQPGAASSNNKQQNCALYLRNIPMEMNEIGVKRFCDSIAEVVKVTMYSGNAMVFFSSPACAEHALKILNQDNRIGIRASFARSKEADSKKLNYENSNQNQYQFKQYPNNFNNRQVQEPFSNPVNVRQNNNYMQDNPSISSNFNRIQNIQLQDRLNKFRSTENAMKKMTISQEGQHSKNGTDFVKQKIGPCVFCNKPSDKQCNRCKDFYCSVECQQEDWPNHRDICLIPKLISSNNVTNSSNALSVNPKQQQQKQHQIGNNHPKEQYQQKRNSYDNSRKTHSQSSDSDRSNTNSSNQGNKYLKNNKQKFSPNNKSNNSDREISSKSNDSEGIVKQDNNISNKNQHLNDSSIKTKNTKISPPLQIRNPKTNVDQSEFPKNQANVSITAVIDHRTIYIRSVDKDADWDYIKILQDCAVYEKNDAKPLTELPDKGDIVLAEFLEQYYRAIVLKVTNETNISVAFIDFGNKAIQTMENLKCLSNDLQMRTRYTHKIQLDGIPKQMTNDKPIEYLNTLSNTPKIIYKLLHIDGGDGGSNAKTYELIETETNESINKRICQLNLIIPVTLTDLPIFRSEIPYKGIVGENLELIILSNSLISVNSISCILKSDLNELMENENKFQEYCKTVHEKYTPRFEEICLVYAETDKTWYRGEGVSIAGDGFPQICFIDYGNINEVKIENIRKMPKEFGYRCITSECTINGLPDDIPIDMEKRLKDAFAENSVILVKKAELLDESDNRSSKLYLSDDIIKNILGDK